MDKAGHQDMAKKESGLYPKMAGEKTV